MSLFAVLAFGGILFAGCKDKEKDKEPEPAADPEATVLVDNTYESFNVFGNNKVVSGEVEVDNDWAVKEYNGMTAISLKQAKAINEGVYNTLKTKSIKGLYKFEGLILGTKDAGWSADKLVDGTKESVNGSYAFKACGCDKNDDDVWVKTAHMPSAEVHGESLTPSTLFITSNMSATKDANGFDHNSNPVAMASGVYTVVLATYKAGVGDMNIMCGVALVKTGDRDPYQPPTDPIPVTSMDVAGAFEGWGTAPVAMTKTGNVFEAEITIPAYDPEAEGHAGDGDFKVRINCDWAFSLGSGALADGTYHDGDGNISKEAGTYLVHVELSADAMADFRANKTIVSFTVTPANV